MPTISISRDYSTSKNLKMYIISSRSGGRFDDKGVKINIANGLGNLPKQNSAGVNQDYYFNFVPNLQEIPELVSGDSAGSTDTIEITTLQDAYHEFADGLKNYSDNGEGNSLSFTFLFDKDCYNGLQEQIKFIQDLPINSGSDNVLETTIYYQIAVIVLPDGSYFAMRIKDMATTFSGVGVNSALTFQLTITLDGGVYWNNGSSELPPLNLAGVLKVGSGKNLNTAEDVKMITSNDDKSGWINKSSNS